MNDAVRNKPSISNNRLAKNSAKKQPQATYAGNSRISKENEPVKSRFLPEEEEEMLMSEIRTTAETADRQALEAIQGSLKEAKRAVFEPELPPDVEDAGVVNPVKKAEEVVSKGSTIELPIDEEEYKDAQKTRVAGKSDNKSIIGVSSIAALAIYIGRLFKMAHKHTMKIVFRKGGATGH
jgi:hypothetical protein